MADFIDIKQSALNTDMRVSSALKQRRIYLWDEVTRDSIFEICYFLNKLRDIDKKTNIKQPIEIHISSYGGYCYDGFGLISLIESMKSEGYKIITVIDSYAMSMAFLIGMVGSERKANRYARFMAHSVSSGVIGTLQKMQDEVEETSYLWELYKSIAYKYSDINNEQFEYFKERNKDWFMSAEEAKELGVIDIIL